MLDALIFSKTPALLSALYADCLWKVNTTEKKLYLTFDDGPTEGVTPWVVEELEKWGAKATFFCIGKNVAAHPDIFRLLIEKGHTVGNHTYNHLNGWKQRNELYYSDADKGESTILHHSDFHKVKFFRPPYGKLKPSQYRYLKTKYQIVMWDVLSFDFNVELDKETVLKNVLKNATSGSIIVFHDSLKAKDKMLYALPKVLAHFSKQEFKFEALC